jgi:hypothetical protein
MAEHHGPEPTEVVAALQSSLQLMIDAARSVLDVAERLVHDPQAAARATEVAEGLLNGLASLRFPSPGSGGAEADDDLERIEVE